MNINEFNDDYFNEILHKLSEKNKTIFVPGDFSINLLNYDFHPPTNDFLDSLSSHYFLPHIYLVYMAVPNIITGNLTASILDHLAQFLVVPNIFFNAFCLKPNSYEKD